MKNDGFDGEKAKQKKGLGRLEADAGTKAVRSTSYAQPPCSFRRTDLSFLSPPSPPSSRPPSHCLVFTSSQLRTSGLRSPDKLSDRLELTVYCKVTSSLSDANSFVVFVVRPFLILSIKSHPLLRLCLLSTRVRSTCSRSSFDRPRKRLHR
jgi:hypothetical protein